MDRILSARPHLHSMQNGKNSANGISRNASTEYSKSPLMKNKKLDFYRKNMSVQKFLLYNK